MDDSEKDAPQPAVEETPIPVKIEASKTDGQTPSAATKTGTVASSTAWQRVADTAIHFLSHASNEALGACLVGLSASTYLILGRVGLVVIGVAGGIVLHATWEGIRGDDRDEATKQQERERRREAGIEVARRVLGLRTRGEGEGEAAETVLSRRGLDYSSFGPETETALNAFTDAAIKDYVHYWYDPTLPGEQSFPAACRETLVAFLLSISGHLRRKRPADAFLDFTTNASSIIIVFLQELAEALNASPNSAPQDAIATYLEIKPDSSLSYMLNKESQDVKLADFSEDILQAYLDPKAYNCPPVHVFLKQVLAQLILSYTITYCSEADFINEWIVYGLEESETTSKVMNMVDAGVEGKPQKQDIEATKSQAEAIRRQEQRIRGEREADARPILPERPGLEHDRRKSRAEEAMDEAMQEAKRLTQLMIEEDERRARESQEGVAKLAAMSSTESISDVNTHGAPTPISSQSDRDRQEDEAEAWKEDEPIPQSPVKAGSRPMTPNTKTQFTSFDQIFPHQQPTALQDEPDRPRNQPPPLTLHNATVNIFDDSNPTDRTAIRNKPQTDYMIQIEPAISAYSGWMIPRKYADFEVLHEVLRRISVITGVHGFTQAHAELPQWRKNTKATLRDELERYLTDAVRFQPLAESEGMKRFLEKDQGLSKSPGGGKGFGWPTPDAFGKFGGDMMTVLTKAPKQVAGGGKAVLGGVAGLVGGAKRPASTIMDSGGLSRSSTNSVSEFSAVGHKSRPSPGLETSVDSLSPARESRESRESLSSLPPKMRTERQGSVATTSSRDGDSEPRQSASSRTSAELSRSKTLPDVHAEETPAPVPSVDHSTEMPINLPPPPSEIREDFDEQPYVGRVSAETARTSMDLPLRHSIATADEAPPPRPPRPTKPPNPGAKPSITPCKPKEPLTERETSVAIELLFAVITELYTLSSAWNIRRTLLTAAKNFLLRPGNPQLLAIRDMLQTSLLDSNLSDSGVASHICKLRENGLATAEEMEIWKRDYPEKTAEQKEELRRKARELLVKKGMPMALQSLMGAAASGEAMGRVFDCLQVPEVARGLVFGILVQAVGIVTH